MKEEVADGAAVEASDPIVEVSGSLQAVFNLSGGHCHFRSAKTFSQAGSRVGADAVTVVDTCGYSELIDRNMVQIQWKSSCLMKSLVELWLP